MPGGSLLSSLREDLTWKRLAIMAVLAIAIGIPLGTVAGQQYLEMTAPAEPVKEDVRPTEPVPLTPEDDALLTERTPTFRWTPSEDASLVRYAIQYSVDPTFRTHVYSAIVFGMMDPTYTPSEEEAFPAGTTIYWRVIAIDEWRNSSPWSPVQSFTTGAR